MKLKREDYKAVKHMNNTELSAYLERIYKRGFEVGYKAGVKELAAKTGHSVTPIVTIPEADPSSPTEETEG